MGDATENTIERARIGVDVRPPAVEPAPASESDDFGAWRRRLNAETAGRYKRFIAGLSPQYGRAWCDIGFAYLGLAATLVLAAAALPPLASAVVVLGCAVLIGYGLAFLQLFIHEAAHGHLNPDRRLNDRLANIFIAWHLGADISRYRVTHLVHHRSHGTVRDSERSYFNALTPRFLVEMLTGVQALRVFLTRAEDGGERARSVWPLARGVLAHLALLAILVGLGAWRSAIAWVLGVGVFLPFFSALRQLLEHRAPQADRRVDYSREAHGAYTRVFKGGLIAETLGGAGFNRHLLHHWEPQVPYTRLAELEAFLKSTSARPFIEARTTTYGRTLRGLWRL